MKSSNKHWDAIFSQTENSKLGWYEKDASQTLELLDQIPEWKKSTIFLAGLQNFLKLETNNFAR